MCTPGPTIRLHDAPLLVRATLGFPNIRQNAKAGICVSEAPRCRSIRCRLNLHGTLAAAYKPYASAEQTWRRCAVFLPVPSDNGERCLRTELEQHYHNCLHRGDRNESAVDEDRHVRI